MAAIPPELFYGSSTPPITHPLLSPADPTFPPPAHTSVTTNCFPPTQKPSRKPREEFSARDLDQLLSAVIEVNPFMAPRSMVGEKWKTVASTVQGHGYCLNREPETLKNKVAALLSWVEGGKKRTMRSHLGREWEHNPAMFASLSGKLDAIQHLKIEAKDTREETKERVKEAQNASRAAGEALRASMMIGHRKRKNPASSRSPSANADSDKENEVNRSGSIDSGSEVSKKTCMSRTNSAQQLGKIVDLMERHEKFQEELLKEQRKANEVQERVSNALLDILRQGLLNS